MIRMKWTLVACAALLLAAPVPARAEGGMDGFMMGLNGVLTSVVDPFANLADPPDRYDGAPLPEVTGRVLGFIEGIGVGAFRAASGVVDMVAAPFGQVPSVRPEPRFALVVDKKGI